MHGRVLTLVFAGILAGGVARADPLPVPEISSSTVIESSAPERGMTQPTQDRFFTLTRTPVPADQLPTTVETLTPGDFRRFGALNVGEAITHATSVQTFPIGSIGSALTAGVRGSTPQEVLVLIDGRAVQGVSLGSPNLSEIPIDLVDRIEIWRGGGSTLYGPNAVGGVINVITKRATYPGRPISDVSFEYRSFDTSIYRLNFGSRRGPFDYFFYGNSMAQSGFRLNSDVRSQAVGGNFGISLGKGGKILVDAGSYHHNAGDPGQIVPPVPTNQFNNQLEKVAVTPNARQETNSTFFRTSYLLPLPMDSLMSLRGFASERELNDDNLGDPNPAFVASQERNQGSNGGEAQFILPYGFTVGGSFVHDREDYRDPLNASHNFQQAIENYGLYAQEEFRRGAWALIPSGRYDHNSQAGDSNSPRVQAIADATDWLRLSGAAAHSFATPTLDQLFIQRSGAMPFTGNPALRPEKAWTYDAGFELHQESASFRATYFRANVKDLIQIAPITRDTAVNVPEARRQGAELEIRHAWNAHFQHSVNYTYLENRGKPAGVTDWTPLALSPRHAANYLATWMSGRRWRIDSTVRYEDSRYAGNGMTGTKLGSQLLWDLRLAFKLRQLELYAGVNDVTNKRYEAVPGYPLPGRTAYGGLSLRLWD